MAKQLINDRFLLDIEKELCRGGMGSLYEAHDADLNLQCVIKTLKPENRTSSISKLAVQRELAALASLHHPNIVKLIAHGESTVLGQYIVLEKMTLDLKTKCAEAVFPDWSRFWAAVGDPVLDALTYAYAKHISHRDVKPSNIMFDEDDTAKLIDFGISGPVVKDNIDTTLANHASGPYSPPEPNCAGPARDVYGFAASAVYALAGVEFRDRAHLIKALDEVSVPSDIRELLSSCLSLDPDSRPKNTAVLRAQITRSGSSMSAAKLARLAKRPVYVYFENSTKQAIRSKMSFASIKSILKSISEAAYAEIVPTVKEPAERIRICGPEFTIVAERNPAKKNTLYVIHIVETRPTLWSIAQEHWNCISYDFQELAAGGNLIESEFAIEELFGITETFFREKSGVHSDSLFELWTTVLRARSELSSRKYPILVTTSMVSNGARITVELANETDSNIIGLHYFVEAPQGRVAAGTVESVDGDSLTLYCETAFDPDSLRSATRLRYNESGTQQAIKHQEIALERFRRGSIPNPRLADYVIDPRSTPCPMLGPYSAILDVDEDKQMAVRSALASEAIFLVVGPPGTGKTELIAELVLQEVKRNPSVRILLSAQTHMAVDNALTRIKRADSTVSCIRLGRASDRISPEASEHLLERIAPAWRRGVSERAKVALSNYAKAHGADINALIAHKVAREAEEARLALANFELGLRETKAKRANLDEIEKALKTEERKLEKDEVDELLLQMEEEHQSLLQNLKSAEASVWEVGARAAVIYEQVRAGQRPKLPSEAMSPHIDKLLSISASWLQRLTLAHEFFPAMLAEAQVVAGTCLGFAGVSGTAEIVYDLAIIEEASRALPQEVLVPASRAKRVIVVGDSKQLPPFLESEVLKSGWLAENNLQKADVQETLFDRLEKFLPDSCIAQLSVQYRMHPDIGRLIASVFYPQLLRNSPDSGGSAATLVSLGFRANVLAVSTSGLPSHGDTQRGQGFENICEVGVIREVLTDVLKRCRRLRKSVSIAILTPYVAQRKALEQSLVSLRSAFPNVDLLFNTVHTFQGKQADLCIFSCVRADASGELGFTSDSRLTNVALSRGRGGLIVVGDVKFLSSRRSSSTYREVFEFMRNNSESCEIRDARDV